MPPSQATIKTKSTEAPGLLPRRLAAERLAPLLLGQQSRFSPFSAAEILDGRERAFANKLVTTALRQHGHIRAIVSMLMERGMPKRSGIFAPLLHIGLAELLFVPGANAHAALFTAGEILKADRRGARHLKLLNAVLRAAQRRAQEFTNLPPDQLFPQWLRNRWIKTYGAEAVARFAQALRDTPPLDLSLRHDAKRSDLPTGHTLSASSLRLLERDRPVHELIGYEKGAWWVQDFAATLAARLLTIPQGASVLDMCAAPGGKTAQLCDQGYAVTALDSDPERLARLETNLRRLGYAATTVAADGTTFGIQGQYDAILLDAPCTASGTFRRHPELLLARKPSDIADRVALQRALLDNAVRLLKPGGTLVYCTCSLEPEEGEEQAQWAVSNLDHLALDPVQPDEISGFDAAIAPQGWIRTHPGLSAPGGIEGSMDGFFVARLVKGG